ncbi:hypothetical protein LSH36_126g09010 [Paralvinella palmiformis]|uniref:Uncharacterized protein n=1 Tax=Paralvinella palmiformis TaxID=53620 RepID=A0AAD9JXD5_9ANNE|nr:hypothetical protein LSH36_126g09010 [Paralvinella palmiformis]
MLSIAVVISCCLVLTSTIPVHRNSATEWDKDCFILCHYECSMWKGTDITHCAHQCMARGFDKYRKLFQPQWCFNLAEKSNRKRLDGARYYPDRR